MKKQWKRMLATVLTAVLTLGSISYAGPPDTVNAATIEDTSEYYQAVSRSRVSVHDPSIVKDPETGRYYIFGSHMAWAYSDDLETWTTFENNINKNYKTLFANEIAWASAGDSKYDPSGNMWAPDIVWNPTMGKWCMYMSVNGNSWNSAICLLTANSLNGNWTYVGTVVYSGFTASGTHDYTKTDYKTVTGDTSLPDRYKYVDKNGKTSYTPNYYIGAEKVNCEATSWEYHYGAHAIDACVFYDENGKLWFSYGSWSGGIYIFELNKSTGFRDTSVKYTYENGVSDPYMGKKLGGSSSSGEASYIEYINGYYYLFLSYGGLVANGGYNMRVFRSKNPDGPYTDVSGNNATEGGDVNGSSGKVGTRLMGYYKWSYWDYAHVAQGHNSALWDDKGNAYLFYHTRTNDGTEGHTVRVHQLFTTKSGYLTAAPFEYSKTDEVKSTYTAQEISGDYEILFQYNTNHAQLEYNQPKHIKLNSDKTVSGDASGTWTNDGANLEITLSGVKYEGTLVNQTMEETNVKTLCFTTVGANGSVDTCLWGYKYPSAEAAVSMAASKISLTKLISDDIELPKSGLYGSTITWASDSPFLLNDGTVIPPKTDATATLTATISIGNVSCQKKIEVTVASDSVSASKITSYYTDKALDLSTGTTVSYDNPLKGMDTSNGVTFKLKVKRTGTFGFLENGNIFSLTEGEGKLYFNGGAYLGYNAGGGYFDANMYNGSYAAPWRIGTDFISTNEAEVEIKFTSSGYSVSVNDEEKYKNTDVDSRSGTGKDNNIVGKVPGECTITDYSNVLSYLSTASTLNFGKGSFWPGTFKGTVRDFEIWVEPVPQKPASGNTYYSEDYEGSTNENVTSLWLYSKANMAPTSIETDNSKYVKFTGGGGDRFQSCSFGLKSQPVGEYIFETDVLLQPSTNYENATALFLTGTDFNTTNYTGYLLKLSAPGKSKDFTINDSGDKVTLPSDKWVHIKVAMNSTDRTKAVLTITDRSTGTAILSDKAITVNGNGEISGLYLQAGRGNSVIQLDNTIIIDPGIADYAAFNTALAKAKKYQKLQQSTSAYSDTSIAALNKAITDADNLKKDYSASEQSKVDACTKALSDAMNGLFCKTHSYNNGKGTVITKPTCTTKGKETVTCYFCGDKKEAEIAPSHVAGEWIITKEATTEAEGERVKKCESCKATLETETIPKLTQSGGNTGDNPSGGDNTGNNPSGGDNTGNNPSGGDNTGDNPSGGDNTGDNPSGGDNTGNNPSGGDNTGNNPSGGGNTDNNPSGGGNTGNNQSGSSTGNGNNQSGGGSTGGNQSGGGSTGGNQTDDDSVKKGASYTVGNLVYKVTDVSKKTVTVTGVKKSKKNSIKTITIGKTVKIKGKSYKVTAIANNAFANCKKLTKVTIGANVTKIGKKAFYKDSKLKNIVVNTKKLKSVGGSALKGINKKATIKVPASKLKNYKNLFKKKGQSSDVKIKK